VTRAEADPDPSSTDETAILSYVKCAAGQPPPRTATRITAIRKDRGGGHSCDTGGPGPVAEPDGTLVPRNGNNGETELYQLWPALGESIDWQEDAKIAPQTFWPGRSNTFDYVLNQSGNHFGLGRYNATGSMPQASDIHVFVPVSTPVGTTSSSESIASDLTYSGGKIGFALMGSQTHYTEYAYNPVDTNASPPAPWKLVLIYQSTLHPDSYYFAFEDGTATSTLFGNDGDFNDEVVLVTGITGCP